MEKARGKVSGRLGGAINNSLGTLPSLTCLEGSVFLVSLCIKHFASGSSFFCLVKLGAGLGTF